jgi:hypothetical protein
MSLGRSKITMLYECIQPFLKNGYILEGIREEISIIPTSVLIKISQFSYVYDSLNFIISFCHSFKEILVRKKNSKTYNNQATKLNKEM